MKSKHIETALEPKQKVVFTKLVTEKLADASNSDMDRNNSKNNYNGYAVCNDNTNISNPHTRLSADIKLIVLVRVIMHR
jgi:hypothetical protein